MPGTVKSAKNYVDVRAGWRTLAFSVLIALTVGVAVRLVINPDRIKTWADQILAAHGTRAGIKFQSVNLDLARESFPQFALELNGVEASPAAECRAEPSIRISKLRVPLDLLALFRGRIAIGTVWADGVVVDLDGLKSRCPQTAQVGHALRPAGAAITPPPPSNQSTGQSTGQPSGQGRLPAQSEIVEAWWRPEQFADLKSRVRGVRFNHLELQFEGRTKKVYLDDFSLRPAAEPDAFEVSTELRIPPELAFDENLPLFHIDAIANPSAADVTVKAGLSEGSFQAKAELHPAKDNQLQIDVQANVQNVPLSTLAPVIVKSGLVKTVFKPRFLWMDCQAQIHGLFQGLFDRNPLTLEKCQVVGDRSKMTFQTAVREPDGTWRPFVIALENVDVGRILETFDAKALDSVFADYGHLSGRAEFIGNSEARVRGIFNDAQVRFSKRGEVALQVVKAAALRLSVVGARSTLEIDQINLDGGIFKGLIEATSEASPGGFAKASSGELAPRTDVRISIERLKFHDAISQLLFAGTADNISGTLSAEFLGNKLKAGNSSLRLTGLVGKEIRSREVAVRAEYLASSEETVFELRSPEVELATSTWLMKEIQPLFFEHRFLQTEVPVRDVFLRGRWLKTSAFSMDRLKSSLETGRVHLSAAGLFTLDHRLDGWINVDYPLAKRLKWKVSGVLGENLQLADDSKALLDLRSRGIIDDTTLGLPATSPRSTGSASLAEPSLGEKTGRELKELGETVIRKARNMIPTAADPAESGSVTDKAHSDVGDPVPVTEPSIEK